MFPQYEYKETDSKSNEPEGADWEFWGMRITPEDEEAVWRRIEKE